MNHTEMDCWNRIVGAVALVTISIVLALSGCGEVQEKEKVLDLNAPGIDLEIEKSDDGTSVEIKGGNESENDAADSP